MEKAPPNILFLDWVPRMAILEHPSTNFFLMHGGARSLYESMFTGVRVIVYFFFADQPAAAITVEKNGTGLKLLKSTSQEEAIDIVRRVAQNKTGGASMQANTNRFKALVQIRSKHGFIREADIVEEVLFTHRENGAIPYRWDMKRNMSLIKTNNNGYLCNYISFSGLHWLLDF